MSLRATGSGSDPLPFHGSEPLPKPLMVPTNHSEHVGDRHPRQRARRSLRPVTVACLGEALRRVRHKLAAAELFAEHGLDQSPNTDWIRRGLRTSLPPPTSPRRPCRTTSREEILAVLLHDTPARGAAAVADAGSVAMAVFAAVMISGLSSVVTGRRLDEDRIGKRSSRL